MRGERERTSERGGEGEVRMESAQTEIREKKWGKGRGGGEGGWRQLYRGDVFNSLSNLQ